MFSKPQNHHKSTPKPNSAIIPNSFNIKNMRNLTAPPESPEHPQIIFNNHKKQIKIWQNVSPPKETRGPLKETRGS